MHRRKFVHDIVALCFFAKNDLPHARRASFTLSPQLRPLLPDFDIPPNFQTDTTLPPPPPPLPSSNPRLDIMAAQPVQAVIESLAKAVYEQCLQAPSGYLFSIAELQDLVPGKNNLELTQKVVNELLRARSLSALTQGSQTVFRAVPTEYAEKYAVPTPPHP